MVLVLFYATGYPQFTLGTRKQIDVIRAANNFGNAFGSVLKGIKARSEFEVALKNSRKQYWEMVNAKKPFAEIEAEYRLRLKQKDYLLLYYKLLDAESTLPGDKIKYGEALSMLFGGMSRGEIDGGIPTFAYEEYVGLVEIMLGITDQPFQQEIKRFQAAYDEYAWARDQSEYLFQNPNSPLHAKGPEAYLNALMIATKVVDDRKLAQVKVNDIKKTAGPEKSKVIMPGKNWHTFNWRVFLFRS